MAGLCPQCKGNDTLYCESRGETYCTTCGFVLEENRMVDAITFTETSSGAVKAVGQFIPTSGFTMSYGAREVRELTLQRGYANIQRIADRLRLPMTLVEAAQRVYLLGVQRGFTAGRINQHVAAACLYISCRRDRSPQMLIDFSDVLMAPVKTLGRIFVKLLRVLRIHVPTIDPSLFMERFASQMELEDKSHEVTQTGVRLVQAMTRDWIAAGRRPTGLCGAALLIAARYHGFQINPEDISSIIRMASSTIARRLSEFQRTSTAQLKQADFESTDLLALPIVTEPPCVSARRIREARRLQALPPGEEATREAVPVTPASPAPLALEAGLDAAPTTTDTGRVRLEATTDEICSASPSGAALSGLATRMLHAIEEQVALTPAASDVQALVKQQPPAERRDRAGIPVPGGPDIPVMAPFDDDPLGDLLKSVREKAATLSEDGIPKNDPPTTTLDASSSLNVVDQKPEEEDEDIPEERLSDVSDGEVDAMLLTDEERHAKALIWDEIMKGVMPEVDRRDRERKRRQEQQTKKPSHRAVPRKRLKAGEAEPAASPADSVRTAFEQKSAALARRLDDDALESLFTGATTTAEGPNPHDPHQSSFDSLFG